METLGERIVMINLVAVMFAGGERADVVRREHLGQTAVVGDQGRNDAEVTSDFGNVLFPVERACIVIVE
jgi:hypothetical protein